LLPCDAVLRRIAAIGLLAVGTYGMTACDLDSGQVVKTVKAADPGRTPSPAQEEAWRCAFVGLNAGAPVWDGQVVLDVDAFAKTGAGSVRLDFLIDDQESWNETALARYDGIVDGLRAHGIQVLGAVNYGASHKGQAEWNDDTDGDGMNDYVVDFAASARVLFERFGDRIQRWEIWNEPDCWENPDYAANPTAAGCTYMLPRVYAKLLAQTYVSSADVIASKNLELVSAGLFAHDIDGNRVTGAAYMSEVYDNGVWDWLEANHGRRYPWTYFGYHLYVDQDVASDGQKLTSYLDEITGLAGARGDSSPVLITEIGWQASPDDAAALDRQRENLRMSFDLLEARSGIAGAFWFSFHDFPGKFWGIEGKPAEDELLAQAIACVGATLTESENSCEHSTCGEGGALAESCSPCAYAVCSYRASCCSDTWDAECVTIAAHTTGACRGVCATGESSCAHDECSAGDALPSSCSSCAQSLCARDAYCCEKEWDWICAGEAARDPFCVCS
jgi:hypothetical protein